MAIKPQRTRRTTGLAWACLRAVGAKGFTLVELLVSTAIMLVVILVLLQVIAGMTNIWHNSTGSISTFQAARAAFTTITRTLSRATLKTYIDYVSAGGVPITNSTVDSSTFQPITSFTRASELQFICAPTNKMLTTAPTVANLPNYPGECVFFQAPLGIVATSTNKFLQHSLNTVGFYVEYQSLATASTVPHWLETALNITQPPPRYRLIEFVQPTENTTVYASTSQVIAAAYSNSLNYINNAIAGTAATTTEGQVGAASSNIILAENIVLIVFRPRLEPQDEITMAPLVGTAYSATTANSIISPNYNYDSRAWWSNSTTGAGQRILSAAYATHMRNQLPPIMDVAMVAVDPNSIIRYGSANPQTATSPLIAPNTLFGESGDARVNSSANLDADLATFGTQLSNAHIRYRIFRSSVQMEGAAWVNN
jgi:uncharacterized protein (TIGR02599 family)